MFGKPQPPKPTPPPRARVSDSARIQGGGLVQIIVTSISPLVYFLFLNDVYVSQTDIESVSIDIDDPDTRRIGEEVVRATLIRYVDSVTGGKTEQHQQLFPCTMEIVALGRRISITCMNPNTTENLFIDVGLKPDGTGSELSGLKALRILITEGIVDAKLTWQDGDVEDLLPQ